MNSNPSKVPMNGDTMNRKTFVRIAAGAVGLGYAAALGYPVYRYLSSPIEKASAQAVITELRLQDAAKLRPGTALMFRFGPRPSMLIHHADGTWTALEAVCTHLGCTVGYFQSDGRFHCPCHGSVFAADGAVQHGPAPRPLEWFEVTLTRDGKLKVDKDRTVPASYRLMVS